MNREDFILLGIGALFVSLIVIVGTMVWEWNVVRIARKNARSRNQAHPWRSGEK